MTRFRLTERVARSVCNCRVTCHILVQTQNWADRVTKTAPFIDSIALMSAVFEYEKSIVLAARLVEQSMRFLRTPLSIHLSINGSLDSPWFIEKFVGERSHVHCRRLQTAGWVVDAALYFPSICCKVFEYRVKVYSGVFIVIFGHFQSHMTELMCTWPWPLMTLKISVNDWSLGTQWMQWISTPNLYFFIC